MYIHELQDWPRFTWNRDQLGEPLAAVRHRQGRLIGHMEALGFNLQQEAVLKTLTADVLKSSEIEGENLDAEQVRSSIARRLGMSRRTLARVLRSENAAFSDLLDASRQALSRRYLLEQQLPITEVAWLLGYSDLSSFTRAFTRWTGLTPKAYRNSKRVC